MVKYLVTGGCGFIGSHLVDLLAAQGHTIRVVDDLSNSSNVYLPPNVEFIHGSISDEKILRQAVDNVECIFHLAAMVSVFDSILHRHKNHLVNCGAKVRLFELAKKVPIIFASTAAVYGDISLLPHQEKMQPKPLSPYAVDKFSCELHARVAWELDQTPSIAFRFFNVYGPRQNPLSPYSGVISKFMNQIPQNKPVTIFGDGNQKRDFIYVKDVAHILFQAMEHLHTGAHVYNLCSGAATSINELADMIGKIAGVKVVKEYAPARKGEVSISQGDPSQALADLGLRPQTSLTEGLTQLMLENGSRSIIEP